MVRPNRQPQTETSHLQPSPMPVFTCREARADNSAGSAIPSSSPPITSSTQCRSLNRSLHGEVFIRHNNKLNQVPFHDMSFILIGCWITIILLVYYIYTLPRARETHSAMMLSRWPFWVTIFQPSLPNRFNFKAKHGEVKNYVCHVKLLGEKGEFFYNKKYPRQNSFTHLGL